ncbi:glycosyltransferase [Micrococcus sp. XM4230B]|uniref:glycosyltransferase n=1 Tax=Micrococcus sp. XM4230B TaxID=2929775 RepID=UPI001FFADC64|nr:glycosyltransferase [Micrococcus sp. XM4230B]MCK1799881.1 glycosyltransferase [Micrococcus sp. XM4230B]
MVTASWPRRLRRVVFVCVDFATVSGGSRYVETFGNILRAAGLNVDVLSVYPGRLESSLAHRSVYPERDLFKFPVTLGLSGAGKLRAAPRYARKYFVKFTGARKAARALQYLGDETVIVFTHVLALEELQRLGFDPAASQALLVGQHHSSYSTVDLDAAAGDTMERLFCALDGMTALSHEDARLFQARLDIPVRAMPNPVEAVPPEDKLLPWSARTPRLVALARFSPEKRLPLLVELAAQALEDPRAEQWRLDIFGEGGGAEDLHRAVSQSGMAQRITVHPATALPLEELRASRINLLASRHEGFGLSLLEAACAGIPSVAFDVSPGVHDLMTTLGGALIPEGDHDAYVAALLDFMVEGGAGEAAGRRALRGARAYAPESVLEHWGRALHEFDRTVRARR